MPEADLDAARRLPDGNPAPTAPTLPALMEARLRDRRHEPYLTFYDDTTGERTELSYATFDNWVCKTANFLREELDLERGDRVAMMLGHHWTAVVIAFACWKAGCCLVTADAHPPALEWEGVRARFVREGLGPAVQASSDAAPETLVVVGVGLGARLSPAAADPGDALLYAEEVLAYGDEYHDPDVDGGDEALLVPSNASGAAVRLSQGNLVAAAEAAVAWGIDAHDRLVCARPVHETDALVLGHLGAFLAGGAVVLTSPGGDVGRKVADERGTLLLASAEVLRRLEGEPPGSLAAVLLATGAPARTAAAARTKLGVPVAVGSGLVEATCAATLEPLDIDTATRTWLDAVGGRPVGCATVRAAITALDDHGHPAPAGTSGRLAVRGPVVMAGYDGPAPIDAHVLAGGWLATGERGFAAVGPDGRRYAFVTAEREAGFS